MKRIHWLIGLVAGVLGASFLLGVVHPFGDPARSNTPVAVQQTAIPPDVRAILSEKCADCHAGPKRLPVYGHFAPASWLMERDVVRARQAMDLSQWPGFSADEQETFRAKIAREARNRSMPPPQYIAMHWKARLRDDEIRTILRWAAADSTAANSAPKTLLAGNAHRGRLVFEKRCTGCHALATDREGPHLQGVYGRTSGSVPGFDDSGALRNVHLVWSDATLDRWLTDPDGFVPGNNMDFHVASPQERADVIRFLQEHP